MLEILRKKLVATSLTRALRFCSLVQFFCWNNYELLVNEYTLSKEGSGVLRPGGGQLSICMQGLAGLGR